MYQIPDHPVIQNMERTGYPDGNEPDSPMCPICLETDIEIVYRGIDRNIIGCNNCIRNIDEDKLPFRLKHHKCPECQTPCETVYLDGTDIVGCDNCITSHNPWEESKCFPSK